MNDPVVQELAQAISAHGEGLLEDRAQLEQLLSGMAATFPGKVKALLILLDKKAVSFLSNWAKDARPNKGSYEQLRQQIATKFEQAKLLNGPAAAWALDAWATALGLRKESVPVAAAPAATNGGRAPTDRIPAHATAMPAPASANPYAPPSARVADEPQEGEDAAFIAGGRAVDAGRGWSWIVSAWGLFKHNPLIWIANFMIFVIIMVAVQLVPFIGGIVGALLAPVLGAGIVLGAQAVHDGGELEVGHLFAGFRERTGALVLVGLLYLIGTIIIVLPMVLVLGMGVLGGAMSGKAVGFGLGVMLAVLVALALAVPLLMAYWFAPALVALNGYDAIEAMKTSFLACLKNVAPFLIYGAIGLVLAILATLPLGFGWFVLAPVGMASLYTSYRDIFYEG